MRIFADNVSATACSIAFASVSSLKLYRSINAAERICAIGFAIPCPAISGAEPPIGSYKPKPLSLIDADGSIPSEPESIAASSLKISPNIFSVKITSN